MVLEISNVNGATSVPHVLMMERRTHFSRATDVIAHRDSLPRQGNDGVTRGRVADSWKRDIALPKSTANNRVTASLLRELAHDMRVLRERDLTTFSGCNRRHSVAR